MTFSYVPADQPAVWMKFVPARENTALPLEEGNLAIEGMVHTGMANETTYVVAEEKRAEEQVSTVAENISGNGVSEDAAENAAGVHISSVDRKLQLRRSQLAKREYHRDSIRMRKGRTVLSSLVRRLNTAQEAAQEKNVERALRKMCGPRLGLPSDVSKVIATTRGRCTDETAVDASMNVDPAGSQMKSSRVASLPLWKYCRNPRLRCPKIHWLYCPSPAAGSDYLSLLQMTRSGTRRPDRAASSQMSSNIQFDSD